MFTRSTRTDLDLSQEKRIDDYWKHLSDSWRRIHKIQSTERKTCKWEKCGPEGDWQRFKQLPDQIMCEEVWTKLFKPLRIENKPEWAKEKPKLDNARTLRGIYIIEPDDREYSDILKVARRKLERLSAPATPCKKTSKHRGNEHKAADWPRKVNKKKKTMCHCLLRAEKFGILITADHKVLNEGCGSRDNHRYVVQDLATLWRQSYPCKHKLPKRPREACKSSWSPTRKPKVIYTDNSLEFGKACEDLSWNHCTSTPHRSETNGIAKRAVRRVKEYPLTDQ